MVEIVNGCWPYSSYSSEIGLLHLSFAKEFRKINSDHLDTWMIAPSISINPPNVTGACRSIGESSIQPEATAVFTEVSAQCPETSILVSDMFTGSVNLASMVSSCACVRGEDGLNWPPPQPNTTPELARKSMASRKGLFLISENGYLCRFSAGFPARPYIKPATSSRVIILSAGIYFGRILQNSSR